MLTSSCTEIKCLRNPANIFITLCWRYRIKSRESPLKIKKIGFFSSGSRGGGPGGPGPPLPPFLRPQIIFWGPNCTFLHSNNRNIFKKFLPRFARHTISILNWHILIKNIRKLFIFEALDYILRSKLLLLHSNNRKIFKKFCLALLGILFQFSIDIFWSKTLKKLFIFEALDYILRPKLLLLHSNNRKFSKNFASLHSAYYFNSQLTYFDQRH